MRLTLNAKANQMTRRLGLGRPSSSLTALLLLCALLSAQLGCGEAFDPYWRIDKLRVLAIQADPPTLKPGAAAQLNALVFSPDDAPITYQWQWCPFRTTPQNDYECPFTREELIAQIEANLPDDAPNINFGALIPDFELGSEAQASLRYPATPEVVLGLCQALQGFLAQQEEQLAEQISVTNCERGYEVSLRLIVEQGGQKLVSSKRINLWTGSEFDQNQNPAVEGIQIRLKKPEDASKVKDKMPWVNVDLPREEQWYLLPEDQITPIVANIPLEVRSVTPLESAELWQPPAPQGSNLERLPPEREVLLFRWMTTGGDLDNSRSLFKEGLNTLEEGPVSEFNVPYNINEDEDELDKPERKTDWDLDGVANAKDNCPYVANADQSYEACKVRIWSIVRDGRLGINWTERQVEVVGHVF